MELLERAESRVQLPADQGVAQSVGQTAINQAQSRDQRQPRLATDDWELQQQGERAFHLEFQDSNLSPALSLLPRVEHNVTEFSFFQQSDVEFAPLRAYPDNTVDSERFLCPPQDTSQASEHGLLSQHPLAQETTLSEDGASISCSLSQHSLSPGNEDKQKEIVPSPLISKQETQLREGTSSKDGDTRTLTDPSDKSVEDDTFFLSKNVPAQHLIELLQKDVGMPSGSSSAVSSVSETSLKRTGSFSGGSKSAKVCKAGIDQSTFRREVAPGEASLSQQQKRRPERQSFPDQISTPLCDISNITMGSRSTQPDDSSEALHRELRSEVERQRSCKAERKRQPQGRPTAPEKPVTPCPAKTSEGKPSVTRTSSRGMLETGPMFSGCTVERGHREGDLWPLGNQTGIDGSYLGFLPQSQSTPGVFRAPAKSGVKTPLGRLSAIESNTDKSSQSSASISPQPAVPVADVRTASLDADHSGPANPCQEEATTAKVQTLPSLNYMQKVDAWRANHALGKTSLFDSLALQGFSGVSPKKKAYDAVSDSLNRILSQQVRNVHQPPVSSDTNPNVTQSSSAARSGSSSPRRGEAVGSAPSDKDDTGSAAWPSASHSSRSTVVQTVQKVQQAENPTKIESVLTQEPVPQQPSVTAEPSTLVSLGHFSDVSLDGDVTFSNFGASIGASSIVSLDVDNYVPPWGDKISTPPPLPRPRELNIEERIPMYLHNLGIDQPPSAILTPFAPRGPIREPEFSPTDLCTIKGSIGTPTKSSQPSDGGSPHKGDFSRCSVLSVDSSISIPLSLDSLSQAVSIPDPTRASSSHITARQTGQKQASYQPEETSHLSAPQTNKQQQENHFTSSQNTSQRRDEVESDRSLIKDNRCGDRDFGSPIQASRGMQQNTADSSVQSEALPQIQNLLCLPDNAVDAQFSPASSPTAAHLLSDDDISLSMRRTTGSLQGSSFSSSSATDDPVTHSSLLWARSSSDPTLTSEKPSSFGQESMTSSGQPDNVSSPAAVAAPIEGKCLPQESPVSRSMGLSVVLSQSARRAEPEGCSAAPPDSTGPAQPQVIRSSLVMRAPQPSSTPAGMPRLQAKEQDTRGGPVESSSSSAITADTEQGAMSDASSESSLAARVVSLLQSGSTGTVVSSTPCITDQEESRGREWIQLKVSGEQYESQELDIEDRMRIEEIKRDLLLQKPIMSHGSTDTEGSVVSSVGGHFPAPPAEKSTSLRGVEGRLHHPHTTLSDSNAQLQAPLRPDLEVLVQEIASREGVTLPMSKPQALTSITIATCRRSNSPSLSTSPAPPVSPASEPLDLCQLSTEAIERHAVNRELPQTVDEEDCTALTQAAATRKAASVSQLNSLHTRDQILLASQSGTEDRERKDTEGGQYEEPPISSQGFERKDVNAEDNTQRFMGDDEFSNKDSSVSGVGFGADRTPGSSTIGSPAIAGHISHVHLTLSPKTTDRSLAAALQPSNAAAVPRQPLKEFVPLRHSSVSGSPNEGVGLSSPPDLHDTREAIRAQGPERADTSTHFKPIVPQERVISASPQSFTSSHRVDASPRPFAVQTAELPVLLPYKPHGSEELFYVPQTEADVSTEPSDTTMESSHPGSDDAVPPRFSSEVLGQEDPGLDRGVTIRHTEGIYSKRLKTASFRMQGPEHRADSVVVDRSSHATVSGSPEPSSQPSVAFNRVSLINQDLTSSRRDQGTSPVHFLSYAPASGEAFRPVHKETNDGKAGHHPGTHVDQSSIPQAGVERDQRSRDAAIAQPSAQQSSSTLDQLWNRFCERWHLEESHPTSERQISLVERLERLSRLIHSTRAPNLAKLQDEAYHRPYTTEQKPGRRGEDATVRKEQMTEIETRDIGYPAERKGRGSRKLDGKPSVPHQAWAQKPQAEENLLPTEEDNHTSFNSTHSQSSSQSQHLCPAERDESETLSTMSGSMSTVDTARLIRAFGAHKVKHLKNGSRLGKLYSTINRQREGMEERSGGGKRKEPTHILTPSETTATDESMVTADSASSASTYTVPSHRGHSRSLTVKKAVKLVSKGIQAGDPEIVINGTRHHTRDVGTTFPSPSEDRAPRQISSSSSSLERGRGGLKSPSATPGFLKPRKSKRSPPKSYPQGVSWFISAERPRGEARKENLPEEAEAIRRPSASLIEPHKRTDPWREPLRQRQVQEDRNRLTSFRHDEPDPDPRSKIASSGLARISLQEALEMHHPNFISRSRQRVKCLALQAEERRLQAIFSREREEGFYHPVGPRRLPRPAGTALLRRAVPKKEMIQRSKQIYESLPEVQMKKEEERRKAEYRSYRLNAQLYNKRITSVVLGRRSAWQ